MMVFVNEAMTWEMKPVAVLREFLVLLQPLRATRGEEFWSGCERRLDPSSTQRAGEVAALRWLTPRGRRSIPRD